MKTQHKKTNEFAIQVQINMRTEKIFKNSANPLATVFITLVACMRGWWSKYNDKILNTRIMN